MTSKLIATALTAILATGTAPALAHAQDGAANPAMTEPAPETFTLTDEQVDAFVEASRGINELVEDVQPRVAAAETPEEQQAIQEEAQAEMTTIVENTGLTVVEYNSIANAARTSASVAERIRIAAGEAQ